MPIKTVLYSPEGNILCYVYTLGGRSKFICKYCDGILELNEAFIGSERHNCDLPFYNHLEEGLGETTNS